MSRVTVVALAASAILAAAGARAPALADGDAPRPARGGVGGGGYVGLTGPGWGPMAVAEFYPGGGFGRYGVRGEVRGDRDSTDGRAMLGVVYEAAAARPRLQLAIHADVGLAWPAVRPVAGGGVQTHLWVIGPVALVTGAGASLRIDGTDTGLALTLSSQLRLAW